MKSRWISLQIEDTRIGEDATVHPEQPSVPVIQHQVLEGLWLDGVLSMPSDAVATV